MSKYNNKFSKTHQFIINQLRNLFLSYPTSVVKQVVARTTRMDKAKQCSNFQMSPSCHSKKNTFNYYLMKPIPTIHPHLIPFSLATIPSEPRKLPAVQIFFSARWVTILQIDIRNEIICRCSETHIKQSKEYIDLQLEINDDCITAYRVVISSGIATVKECTHVKSNLHVKLSYEGCPISLPS